MTTQTLTRRGLVRALRSVVDGAVLASGPEYDRARKPYFEHWVGRPAAVIQPGDAADVAATVDVARTTGADLAVRGGGHTSHSTGDGLLLDLGSLDHVEVDVLGRTAWAGSGKTAGDLTRRLASDGLAVGFGDTGSVGIGGITLGGGVGFLSRRDGLTIDNLLAAEVVTADGEARVVDTRREPDLFWALRGGGGNFGVVTRFRYRLRATPEVYAGQLLLPATPGTITGLIAALTEAPDELTAIVNLMPLPPTPGLPAQLRARVVAVVRVCWSGDPVHATDAAAPLRRVADPYADGLAAMPYASLFEGAPPTRGTQVAVQSLFVDQVDPLLAESALRGLERSTAPVRMVQLRVLGAAVGRVPVGATAYAHRDRQIMVTVVHQGSGDRLAAVRWTNRLAAELARDGAGSYVGFVGPDDAHRVELAYPGPSLARLRAVKTRYDPANMFRNNVNIRPA